MKKDYFLKGIKDTIPIGIGYFAVAFSLGIAAANAGLTSFESFLISILNNASAGEYAGIRVIAAHGTYAEIIIMTIIANARYLLMSTSLSQKIDPKTKMLHRFLIGFDVTDELYALAIHQENYLEPFYYYGCMFMAMPMWASGTVFGLLMGNILPARIVSALSVALFGMFIAIIIPPARKDKIIALLIVVCFISSYLCAKYVQISEGSRIIVLTLIISSIAALLFPRGQGNE